MGTVKFNNNILYNDDTQTQPFRHGVRQRGNHMVFGSNQ